MHLKYFFCFPAALLINSFCFAQRWEVINPKYTCMFTCGKTIPGFNSRESSNKAREIVAKILKQIGLPTEFDVRMGDIDDNVALSTISPTFDKEIILNEKVVNRINFNGSWGDFEDIFIIAHEIGHHLSTNHVDFVESRLQSEVVADEFAGFVLNKLGASLNDISVILSSVDELGCDTHPPRNTRIMAASHGWENAETQKKDNIEENKKNEPIIIQPQPRANPAPAKVKDCEEKNTGEYCFKNITEYTLRVTLFYHNRSDNQQIQVSGGQSGCFYNIPAGVYRFEVGWATLIPSPHNYNGDMGQIKVETCQSQTFTIRPN